MPRATKGRIVLVRLREMGEPRRYNGDDEHPAIVTEVFPGDGHGLINTRVFVDGETNPPWQTSVPHEKDAAPGYGGSTWRWPERV